MVNSLPNVLNPMESSTLKWHSLSLLLAFGNTMLGAMVLIGWYLHNTTLIQVFPAFAPMQYNTALGFLLCGLCLLLYIFGQQKLGVMLAGIVGLLGALTLVQYLFNLNLGIDELLMQHYITVQTSTPGRMAPNTAICFFLVSVSLILAAARTSWQGYLAGFIGAVAVALAVVPLFGYLGGLETAYGWGHLTRMAVHTAAGFIVLGVGIIYYTWRKVSHQSMGVSHWLTILVGVASFTMTVLLWQAIVSLEPAPTVQAGEAVDTLLDEVVLLTGILLTGVLAMLIHFSQKARFESRQRAEMIDELKLQISERQKAEALLQQHTDELQRSNQELEKFAYVASHDLQEPLRMVASYMQLLQRRYHDQLDDKANEFIDYAVDGATRMKKLINDLLTYSRIATKGNAFAETNCNEIIEQVISDHKFTIEEHGATITHDDLPTVWGDQTQLRQLLQNLMANAIKFRGDRAPTVHVGARRCERAWQFSVKDNGIGIEPQFAERIFEIFQRLHSREDYPGTGIGLAICQKIVQRHGGRIWMESQPNKGTTFFFTIPQKGEYVESHQWQAR